MAATPERQSWVVDSIEEAIASIEVDGKTMITVPVAVLPKGVVRGQILRVTISIDEAGTKKALAVSAAQVRKHERQPDDPGGDIAL